MNLALFFTRNSSLKLWVDTGLFDREKLIYQEHLRRQNLQKVYWLTYGKDDAAEANRLKLDNRLHPDIVVLPMPRLFFGKLGCLFYSFLMPLFYYRQLRMVDVLKTNQTDGIWSAVLAKWLYKKPLLVRTGYALSLLLKRKGKSKFKIKTCECVEYLACKYSDAVVVASCYDRQYVCSKYNVPLEKVKVLHNYIDTDVFCPADCKKYTDRIIFVGRLEPEKNLFNLLEALTGTGFALDIYGQGQLRQQLQLKAKELNIQVSFMGIVPNNELPDILNRYHYFVLSSLYEGMPKTLLEAMACGLVCIGTDVEGTNEIIEDKVNGYLAKGTEPEELVEAIKKAVHLPTDPVAHQAVKTIRNKFSIETILAQEKRLIGNLLI